MEATTDQTVAWAAVRSALGTQREQLLALVRRRGGASIDAEDVLQMALQRAFERAHQLRDPGRAEQWVGRIVRNVLIDELRRARVPLLPIDELELSSIEDDSIDCWCVLVQAEQLKPEYATILRRVIIDGSSVNQVANELGLTANNAMVRLHRAQVALKKRMASHCGTTTARGCRDCGCEARGCCPTPTSLERA